MKTFRRISSVAKREAICAALNKLFWKVPPMAGNPDSDENALSWIAELADREIDLAWDKDNQEFVVPISEEIDKKG